MSNKIKVGAVSYLNTAPLLYGIEHSLVFEQIELSVDYPAELAKQLKEGRIDVALLPVAAIASIADAKIISDYGIAAEGNVASVALFSQVPMGEIEEVYLDYQSRTSVLLAKVLLKHYWKKEVVFKDAGEQYIKSIEDNTAGVIIGDRALEQLNNFEYVYDLANEWKEFCGLPFVFAAWVTNKDLPQGFIHDFNQANAVGLDKIDLIVANTVFPHYDLKKYYTQHIQYHIDDRKKQGLDKFLSLIQTL